MEIAMSDESKGNDQDRVVYDNDGNSLEIRFDSDSQAIWITAQDMADLFQVDLSGVTRHIQNIYEDGELEREATIAKFAIVQKEGGKRVSREVIHYNLDVIISVGYRTNAKRAVKFRQWATQTLKTYLEQGYIINEKALRESPEKLNKLASEIRALRSEEKQVYAKVRECFKISASDYDPNSQQVKAFYALLQDKFHHAITGMTSSKLIMDRANHHEEKMGVQNTKGDWPTLKEVQVGKNYLKPDELYRLHLLSEQFLLYAESTALAKKQMTMDSLHQQLDRLLTLNDYSVFQGYKDYLKDEALSHAEQEYRLFHKRLKIESLGYEYDVDALSNGEYDDILMMETSLPNRLS